MLNTIEGTTAGSKFRPVHSRRLVLSGLLAALLGVSGSSFAGAYVDFFRAVKLDDAETIKSLLKRGLDPNLIEEQRGDSGMILALREGAPNVFNVLLNARGINLEIKAKNGDTALMLAAYKGEVAAVKGLLEKGAEPNKTDWTALHYAAAAGNNAIVQMLLDKSAYIDAESPNGTTPIMMAARAGHILTVKLLLDEGADATLRNNLGLSATDLAANNGHKDIVEGLSYRLRRARKH